MLQEFKKFALQGQRRRSRHRRHHRRGLRQDRRSHRRRHHHADHRRDHGRARLLQLLLLRSRSKVTARHGLRGREEGRARSSAMGNFITIVVNFLIIAWVLFLVVRASTACSAGGGRRQPLRRPARGKLLTEIRDLLARDRDIARAEDAAADASPRRSIGSRNARDEIEPLRLPCAGGALLSDAHARQDRRTIAPDRAMSLNARRRPRRRRLRLAPPGGARRAARAASSRCRITAAAARG